MDSLIQSLDTSSLYPRNLSCHNSRKNVLRSYEQLIKEKRKSLFSENQSVVDFWQCNFPGQVFKHKIVNTILGLHQHLRIQSLPKKHDPTSQFIFVQAGHSRDCLKITLELFTNILSYRQVMPSFLDFVFSFGKQQHAEDFHFSGFRGESRLSAPTQAFQIPELGRSGKTLQLCYSLRSVEPAPEEPVPWSIRQTAFYHSFDVESGQASWIVIKGNDCMKNRVMLETQGSNGPDLRSFDTVHQCFSSALATHLLFCEWSAENWRWYINLLEEKVQDITRRALNQTIYASGNSATIAGGVPKEQNTPIMNVKRSWSFKAPPRALTFERFNVSEEPTLVPSINLNIPKPNGRPPPPVLPPGVKQETHAEPQQASTESYQPKPFQFDEVRRIQLIEERATETLLILKTNTTVQEELRQYYSSLTAMDEFPRDIKQLCEPDMAEFHKRIRCLQNDFRMQQARLETLLRLLADRKTLLYGILDFQNMEASKALQEKGQQSAVAMENMTIQMHQIAIQTKQETVSMKIITLVTLFFLPGTFISTLMSTDIIQYKVTEPGKDGKMFSAPALKLFLLISLPMMFFTFIAWGVIYYWAKCRAQKKSNKQDIEHASRPQFTKYELLNSSEKQKSRSRESTGLSGRTITEGTVQLSESPSRSWFSRASTFLSDKISGRGLLQRDATLGVTSRSRGSVQV